VRGRKWKGDVGQWAHYRDVGNSIRAQLCAADKERCLSLAQTDLGAECRRAERVDLFTGIGPRLPLADRVPQPFELRAQRCPVIPIELTLARFFGGKLIPNLVRAS